MAVNILVTGASGFIGGLIVQVLDDKIDVNLTAALRHSIGVLSSAYCEYSIHRW